jgi:ferrous iron transport protein A
VVLALQDSAWTVASGGRAAAAADSATTARLLHSVATLSTVNFATDAEIAAIDFTKPKLRLRVETDSGSHAVEFAAGEGTRLFARKEGEQAVFGLYTSSIANIMKKPDDFSSRAPRRREPGRPTAIAPRPRARKPKMHRVLTPCSGPQILCRTENETQSQYSPAAGAREPSGSRGSGQVNHMGAPLSNLPVPSRGRIVHIAGPRSFRRRIMELGLLPGTDVEVVRVAPLGGPLQILVRGCCLSIRRSEAEHLLVEIAADGTGAGVP